MNDLESKCLRETLHDWPEGWLPIDGIYMHKCLSCSVEYFGYKQRRICKSCYRIKQQQILEEE